MVFNYWGGRLVLRKPVKLGKTLFLFLSFWLAKSERKLCNLLLEYIQKEGKAVG